MYQLIISDKWAFLLLVAAIQLFASFTMFNLISHLKPSGGLGRKCLLLGGTAVYGVAIWVANFIMLLATDNMTILDWTSMLKLLVIVACTFYSFQLLHTKLALPMRVATGGFILAVGKSFIIYAYLMGPHIVKFEINPVLAAASFLISWAGAAGSFYLHEQRGGSVQLLTAAILGCSCIAALLVGFEGLDVVHDIVLTLDMPNEYMETLTFVLSLAVLVIFAFSLMAGRINRSFYAMNQKYKQLVENSLDTIAIIGGERWEYVNRSGLRMFEAENEAELIGKSVFLHLQPKFHPVMRQMLGKEEEGAGRGPIELEWFTARGKTVYTEVVKTCASIPGKPAVQVIIRDISERKKNEELLVNSEKLYVAGQLAAGIAHEIRNPLTSLKGFLQLMAAGKLANKNYFDIMKSELTRIDSIVSELLMLSKPQVYELARTDVRILLDDTMTLLGAQAILHNIEMETSMGDEPLWVVGVENQLKQVFINVLKNAIEAMTGGGTIVISSRREGEHVVVQIQDDGPGIPEEQLCKIGQPFYTTKEKGTGLGLMVTYKIVHNHNGRIAVRSELGSGTKFEISFPYSEPPADGGQGDDPYAKVTPIDRHRLQGTDPGE
jgi:two-component system sporulation sensor kinase A